MKLLVMKVLVVVKQEMVKLGRHDGIFRVEILGISYFGKQPHHFKGVKKAFCFNLTKHLLCRLPLPSFQDHRSTL